MSMQQCAFLVLALFAIPLAAQTPETRPTQPSDSSAQTVPAPAQPSQTAPSPATEAQPAPQPPAAPPIATQATEPSPQTVPSAEPPPSPSLLSQAASSAYERRESFPNVNVYLPEGQVSLRLRKLIKNVLFESQIDYKFVNGDISTFLRYKYYARTYTYRIGVFDTIEFPDVGKSSTNEFERVRGGLLLLGFPRDYDRRVFFLLQDDRLTFGNLANVDNKKNNIYVKLGYQYGTQFDERLNAIVGESRGRITPVLTAFRDIGRQKSGYAIGLTQTANVTSGTYKETSGNYDLSIGDYKYTKLEAEGLRRFDLTSTSFVFSRLHLGSFLAFDEIPNRETRPSIERYTIPRYEMFSLGGREALRSISDAAKSQATREIHLTNEYFVPIFRNRDYHAWMMNWNTMYGIAYLGAGSASFDVSQLFKTKNAVVDAGIGTESSIAIRDFEVLLSVLYAHTVKAPDELKGGKVRFSIRTIR